MKYITELQQAEFYEELIELRKKKKYPENLFFYSAFDDPNPEVNQYGVLRKDYSEKESYKVLKKFTKPRSPRTRLFLCNDPDGWFIDVLELKTKTGEVTDNEGWITEKDLEQWCDWHANMGWVEQKV